MSDHAMSAGWRSDRGHAISAGLFAVAFGYAWVIAIAQGFNQGDEAWFLQVATRVLAGETLYRDVFYGATPLAVYVTAGLMLVFGTEVLALKALIAAGFAATAVLSRSVALRLGVGWRGRALLLLGLGAYAAPWADSAYSMLASTATLGCFWATLRWRSAIATSGERQALVGAAALAGLAAATKQNLGLAVLAALLLAVALYFDADAGGLVAVRALIGRWLVVLATFTIVVALALLPVLISGGWAAFVDYAFLNKTNYVRLAGYSLFDEFSSLVETGNSLLRPGGISSSALLRFFWWQRAAVLMLSGLAIVALITGGVVARGIRWRELTVVLGFVAALTSVIYPRADVYHVTYAVPAALAGLAYAGSRLRVESRPRPAGLLFAAIALWLALGVVAPSLAIGEQVLSGQFQRAKFPHLRGVLVHGPLHTNLELNVARLAAAVGDEPVLMLIPTASFYYLAGGLRNPTPFDYPLATAFGLNGEAETIARIADGTLPLVCLDEDSELRSLQPAALTRYVSERMFVVTDVGPCRIYRLRPGERTETERR